jgi:hypothetical protein
MTNYAFIPPERSQRLRRPASSTPRVGTTQTARLLARRLTASSDIGLRFFADTGIITPAFYADLARLYKLRRPEVERWLDTLTRFGIRTSPADTPTEGHGAAAAEH